MKLAIDPFVDGSIRREPDLEHEWPSISCLCRAGKFAPRLAVGDAVAYLTKKGKYGDVPFRHWRLTAVLQVIEVLESHEQAAAWYRNHGYSLPNNCMVLGNPPNPIERSNRQHRDGQRLDDRTLIRWWDWGYGRRARANGTFVICRRLFCELSWNAPVVDHEHMVRAFGRPRVQTRNPERIPSNQFRAFLEQFGIGAPPSVL